MKDGKQTHHLHVVSAGSPEIDGYRRFRDWLRRDSGFAAEYEKVKLKLAAEHGSDRMLYVEAKSHWVADRLKSLPPDAP